MYIFFSQSTLYMFGGRIEKKASNELWSFDTRKLEWGLVTSQGDTPLPVAGHTATLVDTTMIVLFGYGPNRGYTDRLQEFDLGINTVLQMDINHFFAASVADLGDPGVQQTQTDNKVNLCFYLPRAYFH